MLALRGVITHLERIMSQLLAKKDTNMKLNTTIIIKFYFNKINLLIIKN